MGRFHTTVKCPPDMNETTSIVSLPGATDILRTRCHLSTAQNWTRVSSQRWRVASRAELDTRLLLMVLRPDCPPCKFYIFPVLALTSIQGTSWTMLKVSDSCRTADIPGLSCWQISTLRTPLDGTIEYALHMSTHQLQRWLCVACPCDPVQLPYASLQ